MFGMGPGGDLKPVIGWFDLGDDFFEKSLSS